MFLPGRLDVDVAVEHVEGDRARSAVRRDGATRPQHHEGHAERPLLHERPGVAAMAREQLGIVDARPLVAEVEAQDIGGQRTVDG